MTTYFVEERSGVIGLGPIAHSPDLYFRQRNTNWNSITTWIHLIICILAIPLIIWNLYQMMDAIEIFSPSPYNQEKDQLYPHILVLLIVFCSISMNLLGGLFALVTETACFSERLAKFIYVMAYLSIVIPICALVISRGLLNIIWVLLLLLFVISFGIGFWRFTIISAIYLNEEGPVWFKPLFYFCLAAIPFLSTSARCQDDRNIWGCLPNDLYGGRIWVHDLYSFVIMIIIALLSAIPYLLGIQHIE